MSYAVSALDASGTPVLVGQRTRTERRQYRIRSSYAGPVAVPPTAATANLIVQFAITLARGSTWPTYTTSDGQVVAVSLAEKHRGRQVQANADGQKFTRTFLIQGTGDPAMVQGIGPQVGDADDVLPGFYVEERIATPYATGGEAADIVQLVVTYTKPGAPSSGADQETTFSYEFGSESEHVDKAIAQVHYGDDGARVGDLINVTDEEVQGVDINCPILDITEEHIFTEPEFNTAARQALGMHLQKTNSAPFREWAIGEVLFVGASARKQAKRWFVTYQFRVRRNASALAFTVYSPAGKPSRQSVEKRGWQYLWVESIRALSADLTKTKIVPRAVHVATVYDEIDFAVLGIGTKPLP